MTLQQRIAKADNNAALSHPYTVIFDVPLRKYVACARYEVPSGHQPMRYFRGFYEARDWADAQTLKDAQYIADFYGRS